MNLGTLPQRDAKKAAGILGTTSSQLNSKGLSSDRQCLEVLGHHDGLTHGNVRRRDRESVATDMACG
jgi:hypothetical protein